MAPISSQQYVSLLTTMRWLGGAFLVWLLQASRCLAVLCSCFLWDSTKVQICDSWFALNCPLSVEQPIQCAWALVDTTCCWYIAVAEMVHRHLLKATGWEWQILQTININTHSLVCVHTITWFDCIFLSVCRARRSTTLDSSHNLFLAPGRSMCIVD